MCWRELHLEIFQIRDKCVIKQQNKKQLSLKNGTSFVVTFDILQPIKAIGWRCRVSSLTQLCDSRLKQRCLTSLRTSHESCGCKRRLWETEHNTRYLEMISALLMWSGGQYIQTENAGTILKGNMNLYRYKNNFVFYRITILLCYKIQFGSMFMFHYFFFSSALQLTGNRKPRQC